MAVFTFYKFTLNEPSLKNEIFSEFKADSKLDLKVAQQLNDGSFDDHFGMPKVYNNDIIANHDNILVMTIENNKKKDTTIEKKIHTHEHHPFCHVIIDYRDGRVERQAGAGRSGGLGGRAFAERAENLEGEIARRRVDGDALLGG